MHRPSLVVWDRSPATEEVTGMYRGIRIVIALGKRDKPLTVSLYRRRKEGEPEPKPFLVEDVRYRKNHSLSYVKTLAKWLVENRL